MSLAVTSGKDVFDKTSGSDLNEVVRSSKRSERSSHRTTRPFGCRYQALFPGGYGGGRGVVLAESSGRFAGLRAVQEAEDLQAGEALIAAHPGDGGVDGHGRSAQVGAQKGVE
jgi:hypothetical protein